MLESLEQSNIKRMAVEQQKEVPEILFDLRRDVSEEAWKAMEKEKEEAARAEDVNRYLKLLINLRKINPDRSRKTYQSMSKKIDEELKATNPLQNLEFFADVYELNEFKGPKPTHISVGGSRYKTSVQKDFPGMITFLEAAKRLGVAEGPMKSVDEEYKNALYQFLESVKSRGEVVHFAELAAKLKSIWPDREIPLDNDIIRDMQAFLDATEKEKYWMEFSELAADMARLTEKPDETLDQTDHAVPKMPEQKNF